MSMTSSFHNTIATLARCKKPLSHFVEFVELKKQVTGLHKSEGNHATNEREMQASVEYLTNQVHALSEAFRVLSGVVVDEVDGLKKELRTQRQDLKAVVKAHASQMQWTTSVQREMSDLRASMEKDLTEEAIAAGVVPHAQLVRLTHELERRLVSTRLTDGLN